MEKAWDWPVPFISFTSVCIYVVHYCLLFTVSVFWHMPWSSEKCVCIRINACGLCLCPLASLFKTWQWAGNLYFDSVWSRSVLYTFQYCEHYLFPECISSKASLILSKGSVWVTNSSTLIFLDMYSVTSFGTLSTLFQPERRKTCLVFSLFHPSQKIKTTSVTQALVRSIWKGTETSAMFVPPMVVWQKHTLSKGTSVDEVSFTSCSSVQH